MKNVLEWLETTVEKYPDKPAFSDTECSITFAQVYDIARNTGAYLIEQLGVDRTPVAVFAGRKMVTPAYFLGVVYAGRPYAPIDASLPDKRIEKILENLCPRAIVADRESREHVESIVDEASIDRRYLLLRIYRASSRWRALIVIVKSVNQQETL